MKGDFIMATFLKEGKAKLTLAENCKTMSDYEVAISEAKVSAKPYFLSFEHEGFEYRAIGWNDTANPGKILTGEWSHKICKSLDDLAKVATPAEIFGYAYAQYKIKQDAKAVKPETSGRTTTSKARQEAEHATSVAMLRKMVVALKAAGQDEDAIASMMATVCNDGKALNEAAIAEGLDVSFSQE